VVWAQLPPPFGRRPVVVITRDAVLGRMNNLTVAPITRNIRNVNPEVVLQPVDGVPTPCAITLDNIFTIPRSALGEVIVVLPREKLLLVFAAIRNTFDMS